MSNVDKVLPLSLLQNCGICVRAHHAKRGMDGLPSKLTSGPDDMPILATMGDTIIILNNASLYWKLRKSAWVFSLIIIAASFYWSFWLLPALFFAFVYDRYFSQKEKECYMYLSSVLLGLDMLAYNFAGLGFKYPDEADNAHNLYDNRSVHSVWLDYYLPLRGELNDEILLTFNSF